MLYRGAGFLGVILFGSIPSPYPHQLVASLSQYSCVSPVELTDGGGGGIQIIRRESLVLYNLLSIGQTFTEQPVMG
jgi:hypothetical protein